MIIYDGQKYENKEDIPDLGSLVGTDDGNGKRSYDGKLEDFDKLPTYDDLETGSSASLVSDSGLTVCKYVGSEKKWYQI